MGFTHAFLRYWAVLENLLRRRAMSIIRHINELAESLLSETKFSLYDVERNGGNLKVTIQAEGGVTLDELAGINRQISNALDANDPMPNKYTLEVSSPGLERKLRTRDHFEGAKGEIVGVKLAPHVQGERRFKGRLSSVSSDSILVEIESGEKVEILIDDISKATTVFQWKQNQKPGKSTSNGQKDMTRIGN